jgi:condensin-2 complex subunit D3
MSGSESDTPGFPLIAGSFDALLVPVDEVLSSIDRALTFLLETRSQSLCRKTFELLKRTVTRAQDPGERLPMLLLRLLPLLLMTDANFKTGTSINVQTRDNRDAVVKMIKELKGTENFQHCLLAITQRVVFRGVDKAEWRRATVETVDKLGDICPEIFPEMKLFVMSLITSDRPNLRVVAVEVLGAWTASGKIPTVDIPDCLQALEGRCVDVAATVRGAAVLKLAEVGSTTAQQYLPDISAIVSRRFRDEKAAVRKAALQAIETLIVKAKEISDLPPIEGIAKLAFDESLATRKASINTLGIFFLKFPTLETGTAWARAVLPLISDPESTVAEKALEVVETFFIKNFRSISSVLLDAVASHYETSEFLQRALRRLLRGNSSRIKSLTDAILAELARNLNQVALWVMLEEISTLSDAGCKRRIGEGALTAWRLSCSDPASRPYVPRVLRILANTKPSEWIGSSEVQVLIKNLHQYPMYMIPAAVRAAAAADPSETRKLGRALVDHIEPTLRKFIEASSERVRLNPETIERKLAVVGEIFRTFGKQFYANSDGFFTVVRAVATSSSVPERIRAAAVLVWGCGCLANDDLAKRSISGLLDSLVTPDQPEGVRHVLLVVVGDLCAGGHANERLILPSLSLNLSYTRSKFSVTRQQTLMTLASLLAEDYVKFRGSLIFRFLYVACDEEPEIQSLAQAVFSRIILPRCGLSIFKTHFLDIIKAATGKDKDFALTTNPKTRTEIYRFVIKHLDNPMKCDVLFALVEQLFGTFLEDDRHGRSALKLPTLHHDPNFLLITDALSILSAPAMRLTAGGSAAAVENVGNEAVEEAEGKLIGNFWAKFLASQILPTVLELKALMERERSPLLRYMEHALLLLIPDFRDQLNEFLVDQHAQLLSEIEFDLEDQQRVKHLKKHVDAFELFMAGNEAPTLPE